MNYKEIRENAEGRRHTTYLPIPEDNLMDNLYSNDSDGYCLADLITKHERYRKRGVDLYPQEIEKTLTEMCGSIINRSDLIKKGIAQSIPKNARFTTFGSCFAAEIHRYLLAYGLESYTITLSDSVNSPRMSRDGLSYSYVPWGKYHWEIKDSRQYNGLNDYQIYEEGIKIKDACNELQELNILKSEHIYRSERLIDQYGFLKSKIEESDVVIFTVGTALRKEGNEFRFESVEDTAEMLKEIRLQIHKLNPMSNVFFTLSPVPLEGIMNIGKKSLTAVEADCISKSTSRVALNLFIDKIDESIREKTFYYPSYELVRWLAPYFDRSPWQDSHHLKREMVKLICKLFKATFIEDDVT